MWPCFVIAVHNVLHARVMYRDNERSAGAGAGVTCPAAGGTDTRHWGDAQVSTNQE
jgi:hypothetical protein